MGKFQFKRNKGKRNRHQPLCSMPVSMHKHGKVLSQAIKQYQVDPIRDLVQRLMQW